MINNKRVGVALSGGGYRAAAFHLGTLNKLNEMNLLDKIDVLSTISGGSITGASYCLHEGDYPTFHQYMKEKINTKNVIKEVVLSRSFIQLLLFIVIFLGSSIWLMYSPWPWLSLGALGLMIFLLLKYQFSIFPASKEVEKAYDKFLYQEKTLKDLKQRPLLAIGSSNLQTGRPFTFSSLKMSDSIYSHKDPPIFFRHEYFPIARAVMASSCVPFAFTPIPIHTDYYQNPNDAKRINPQLVDGGVYDNQGIQKITQHMSSYECDVIITSDAGGGLSSMISFQNTVALLIRTVDIFMYRIKTMQMVEHIYQNLIKKNKPIAYFSLGWEIKRLIPGFIDNMKNDLVLPEVMLKHELKKDWIDDPEKYRTVIQTYLEQRIGYSSVASRNLTEEEWNMARGTGTNLTNLSRRRTDCLISHAENLAELQIKLYCPTIL
jgi:NTE family protein